MNTIQKLNEHLENDYLNLTEQYKEKADKFIDAYEQQNVRLDLMAEMAELDLEISKNRHAKWTIEGLENKQLEELK